MRRHFIINILFLIGLNLLVKPFWIFGIDRSIQNAVGSDVYGLYFAMFNFSFLFNSLLDLGITNFNNWSVARNADFIGLKFKKLAGLKLILGFIYVIVTLLAGYVLGYRTQAFELLSILCVSQFLLSFMLFLRSAISGLQIFWLDSLFSVFDKLLLIVICAVLLWGGFTQTSFKIEWLAWSQLFSYLAVVLTAQVLFIFHKKLKAGMAVISRAELIMTLRNALPFAVIILFMTLYHRLDAVMLERLLTDGTYQSGIYAQGYRFFDMLNNFTYLFVGILFPLLSKLLSENKTIWAICHTAIKLLLIPALGLFSMSVFYGTHIMTLMYAETSAQSGSVFMWLIASFIPLIISTIFGTVVTASGNLSSMIKISGIGFLLNLTLNILLIPHYQAEGAALATLSAQLFMAFATFWILKQQLSYQLQLKKLMKPLLFFCLLLLSSYLMSNQGIKLIFFLIIQVILGLVLLFLLRFIQVSELKEVLRLKR